MPLIYHVYTMYIPCIYQYIPCIYMLILLEPLVFRASWHSSPKRAALSWHSRVFRRLADRLQAVVAEWIANNYAEELNAPLRPDPTQPWSTATLNRILQTCLVSDRKGNNIHTFQTVEFESDLYRGVMRARCYPFNMERHQFRGRNVKVCTYTWYM